MLNKKDFKLTSVSLNILIVSVTIALSIASANERPLPNNQPTSSFILAEHHGGGHGMKRMDTNGDGEISKEEFMAHKEMKFMMKDKNGDGKLTGDEMKHKKCKGGEHKHRNKSDG